MSVVAECLFVRCLSSNLLSWTALGVHTPPIALDPSIMAAPAQGAPALGDGDGHQHADLGQQYYHYHYQYHGIHTDHSTAVLQL